MVVGASSRVGYQVSRNDDPWWQRWGVGRKVDGGAAVGCKRQEEVKEEPVKIPIAEGKPKDVEKPVDPKTQKLYKDLFFKDKNNNGVIEKDEDENYKEKADINKDGKLVKAEILYYLHYVVETAPEKTKQENPITEEDKTVLASLFKEALGAAKTIKDPDWKASAIRDIASKTAEAGLGKEEASKVFEEALVAARKIRYSGDKADALIQIAAKITEAGLGKEKAIEVLKEALKPARASDIPWQKAAYLARIAFNMAKAGLGKEEVSKVFKEALDVARTIEETAKTMMENAGFKAGFKATVIGYIALKMAEAGLAKEEVCKVFKEALDLARTIMDSDSKAAYLKDIVLEMAKAGLFKEALEVASTLENSEYKAIALVDISSEMANAGLFKEALGVARTIEDSTWKASALANTASKMAEAGLEKKELSKLFELALGVARTIEGSYRKASALKNIASEMVKAGLGKEEISKVFKEAGVERPE